MNAFTLSIILIILAGFFQGTFGVGMKKYAPLPWEAFWAIYSIVALIIFPYVWAKSTVPDIWGAITSISQKALFFIMFLGACWGVAAFAFGLAVNYLGISLTYGITMGLSAAMGSLVPMIQISNIGDNPAVPFIIIGLIVMLIGITILTIAGIRRDQVLTAEGLTIAGIKRGRQFRIWLIFTIFIGIGAALPNIAFTYAAPVAKAAVNQGALPRNASLVCWVIILWGGFVSNIVYVIYLFLKNKSWNMLMQKGSIKGVLWALFTALFWFAALGVYGQGATIMGEFGPVIGWTMFLALALIISNIWGITGGEWKGAKKPMKVLLVGDTVLIISWIILGYANSFF